MDMTGDNLPEPSAKEWERLYLQAVDYGEKQAARVAELEAERAELVKDRERLDWLAANWYRFEYFTLPDGRFQWAFRETGKGGRAETLRAAIDAAREEAK